MAGYEQDATIVMNAVPGTLTGITTLISGFASINQQFQNITTGIADGFGLVDAAIISAGALVTKFGIDAAQAYGQFEQGMRIVQVVSGQTGSAIDELSQRANEFSVQYRTDINQITEGLQTLGRAGLKSTSEQTEVLQNGLQTAKLEGRQLNQVLEEVLQNTTLLGGDLRSNEFGEQSTYVNDLLVATSMTAPITSHDISQTLQYSGGLAATAGANINSEEGKDILTDYMATIAAFAQKGVKGSLAGTALRAFLNKPATQDSSVLEGLEKIHLKPEYLWEDGGNTMKPISEQIALIQGQMDKLGVSQMDRLQIWSKILGGKMGQQMMKLDSKDIKELTYDIDSATSSQELANKSMNTFSQNLKQIEEQGQVVFRGIGEHIVKIINPLLPIIQKITELLSNPVATFVIFAGGLALVINAAQRLWAVVKAVRDEFALMRTMATEAFQAITAQSAAASASVSTLGNIMIGGKAGGLTAETNKIAVLNEGLVKTKGLVRDIQLQSLGLGSGTKLLPGQRYGEEVSKSLVGTETRQRVVPLPMGGSKTVDEFRGFHVFDSNNPNDVRKMNNVINAVAEQEFHEYRKGLKPNEVPIFTQNDFRPTKDNGGIRMVGPNESFGYIRGPWMRYNPNEQLFNEQERYAWAMANARSGGEATPITSEEQKAAEEARAAAEKEVARRKSLGFRGRLKEDLGKKVSEFEEKGRATLRMDQIPGAINTFQNHIKNAGDSLKGFGQKIANIKMPFQDSQGLFQQFRRKKMGYLNKADIEELTKAGYFSKESGQQLLGMKGASRSRAALNILKSQGIRDDAIGHLYNNVYKVEKTIGSTLSSFRKSLGNLTTLPTMLSNFKNRLSGVLSVSTLENASAKLQNVLQRGFSGLGTSISSVVARLRQTRSFLASIPERANSIGARFQKGLETSFVGLGNSIRGVMGSISSFRENILPTRESIRELGVSAREAGARLRNLKTSDIKQGIKSSIPSISASGIISRIPSIGVGALGSGLSRIAGGLARGVSTTIGALQTFSSYMGGPVMLAMMAFSAITSFISKKMQEYAEEMNNAKEDIKKAYSQRNETESSLKKDLQEQNPDATPEEVENLMLETYGKMAEDLNDQNKWLEKISEATAKQKDYEYNEEKDDGSLKEKEDERDDEEKLQQSIDENTAALYNATAKIMVALDKMVLAMDDKIWGLNGTLSEASDKWGSVVDTWGGFSEGSSFSESGGFLLSASQKDSNYPGYNEFPGLFLEDAYDTNGSLGQTMDRLFGADSQKVMGSLSKSSKDFLQSMTSFSRGLGRANNSRLQASMMNDKKTWQSAGKEIAKYESKNKKPVGVQKTENSRMENLIKKLQIDTGLSRIQVIQSAYLQQMQDMYTIAEQVMIPLISQNATAAANTLILGQNQIAPLSSETAGSTTGTMNIASSIAAMLSTIAWAKAGEATWNAARMDPNNALHQLAMDTDDGNQFIKEAVKREEGTDLGGFVRAFGTVGEWTAEHARLGTASIPETLFGEKTMADVYEKYGFTPLSKQKLLVGGGDSEGINTILNTFGGLTYSTMYPTMSMKEANEHAKKDIDDLRKMGADYNEIYNWFGTMWGSKEMGEKVLDQYLASNIGEPESDGGSGSGSGGDDGDKDKDTGNKKERVDLVLCSKKEIPKLNVNLFKKPPTFTVLNKNFKVRDVKINTEDKPKAIMSSIKNAFIDVQKRSDPKIIQDEDAVYDPEGATEGNPLPSGTAKTKTDS